MAYQDKWLGGRVSERGYRECAERYDIVKAICAQYDRPFTVCDIGANMCYFGLRLTEDFPACNVVAFEFDHFEMRRAHLEAAQATRILLLERKLTIADLDTLRDAHRFDVVLALSVVHHLVGQNNARGTVDMWLTALRQLGRNLIVEFAATDSVTATIRDAYRMPPDAILLGDAESHLKQGARRPIVLIPCEEGAV